MTTPSVCPRAPACRRTLVGGDRQDVRHGFGPMSHSPFMSYEWREVKRRNVGWMQSLGMEGVARRRPDVPEGFPGPRGREGGRTAGHRSPVRSLYYIYR